MSRCSRPSATWTPGLTPCPKARSGALWRRALRPGASHRLFQGSARPTPNWPSPSTSGWPEINVEAEAELDRLAAIAEAKGVRAPIAIRVNPDVGAGGHAKIATGKAEDKFGVSLSEAERLYARASNSAWLKPLGLACHIGSQITDLAPLEQAGPSSRCGRWWSGFAWKGSTVGAARSRRRARRALFQPARPAAALRTGRRGRPSVPRAWILNSPSSPGGPSSPTPASCSPRVIHLHERPEGRRFLVVDAAMNDLIRPAMYDALSRHPPGQGRGAGRAKPSALRRGRAGGRDRRHIHPRPDPLPPFAGQGDLVRLHVRRRLRGDHVERVQQPPPGSRGAGARRPLRRGPAPPGL